MDEILNPERYDFVLDALLPGFLIFYVFLSFKKAPLPAISSLFIVSIILSFIFRIFLDLFLSISPFPEVSNEVARLINLIITPIILGTIWSLSFDRIHKIVSKFGFHMRHPIPNSWDQAFANRIGCWMIIHLKDGTKIRGEFSGNAHASSSSKERGIYLDTTYEYDYIKGWIQPDKKCSVLVMSSSIDYIEFVNSGEDNE